MLRNDEELQKLSKKYQADLWSATEGNDPDKSLALLSNIKIPLEDQSLLESLFKSSLENKKYIVSIYLFILVNSIPSNYYYYKLSDMNETLSYLLEAVTEILGSLSMCDRNHRCIKLLPELIDHINIYGREIMDTPVSRSGHMSTVFTTNMCTNFYITLCNPADNWKIYDWENVEAKFLEHFKPDYNQAFFIAMLAPRKENAINHLLKTKKVNTSDKTWFRTECGENCFGINETLGQISPFQGILEHMYVDKYNFNSISYDLKIFKIFIENEPLCIKLCDRRNGENILDKIKFMKKFSVEERNGAFLDEINEMLTVINAAKSIIFRTIYLTFFQGTKDFRSDLSVLNDDIRCEIGKNLIKASL